MELMLRSVELPSASPPVEGLEVAAGAIADEAVPAGERNAGRVTSFQTDVADDELPAARGADRGTPGIDV
ncbi:hypothetical protein [Micromonospora aurantiaca (nom. illeg.)]|uniref:hypothetical protein n=1 Tax=Micromonospora aurantiaca (nom. illeg.) TaxID=47850 RepID=UPI0033EE5B83